MLTHWSYVFLALTHRYVRHAFGSSVLVDGIVMIDKLHRYVSSRDVLTISESASHDNVIKWKHFRVTGPLCLEFTSLHKGKWHGALMFSLISNWLNSWVNNREAGDLRRHRADYYVTVMTYVDRRVDDIWGLWYQKQVPQTRISHCIPKNTVGCNYLPLPEIPASDTKVLI